MKVEIKKNRIRQGISNSFKLFAIVLMVLTCMTGCKKDNDSSGSTKISPPSWLQGKWQGSEGTIECTKSNILLDGETLEEIYEECTNLSIKETKNTSSLYVITVKGKHDGESFAEYYAIKKGDGSYVLGAVEDVDVPLDDAEYYRFDKVGGGGGGGDDPGTLSPPAWIQGKWQAPNSAIAEFTKDDVIIAGQSLSVYNLEETATDSYYQIEEPGYWMKFDRGDGSYIEMSDSEDPDVKIKLSKIK